MEIGDQIDLVAAAGSEDAASSVTKAMDVLTLFGADTAALRIEHVTSRLGYEQW